MSNLTNQNEIFRSLSNQIEEKINVNIKSIELLLENRNSLIYKVIDHKNNIMIYKKSKKLNLENITTEYMTLSKLKYLESSEVRIPKAISLFREDCAYLMDYIEGHSLADIVSLNNTDVKVSCELAGKTLAQIHNNWNKDKTSSYDVRKLKETMLNEDSLFSKDEINILEMVFKHLDGVEFNWGYSYKDYDPLNILLSNGKIALIDPPETTEENYLFWDISTFTFGIKKAFYKNKKIITNKRRFEIDIYIKYFFEGYSQELSTDFTDIRIKLFLYLLEYKRINDLVNYQKKYSRIKLGRGFNKYIYNFLAIRILKNEKKRIILKMQHMIKRDNRILNLK